MSFEAVAARIIQGVMVHDEMAKYYDFLAIPCYRDAHIHHAKEEFDWYHKICKHYICHHNMLIPDTSVGRPVEIIPQSWYKYTRDDVDVATKKNAIKSGIEKWYNWETETKEYYMEQLAEMTDREDRKIMNELIDCVSKEEKCAHEKWLYLKTIDWDLSKILS